MNIAYLLLVLIFTSNIFLFFPYSSYKFLIVFNIQMTCAFAHKQKSSFTTKWWQNNSFTFFHKAILFNILHSKVNQFFLFTFYLYVKTMWKN
jgi:hypothetical protein